MSIGAAILVIAILALLVFSKGFRKVAAISFGVSLVAAVLLYVWIEKQSRENARKVELAKTYIKHSEIEIVEPKLSTLDGRPSQILGRIRNNSKYPLGSIELKLILRDCISPEECETVGESEEAIYVVVPPGQSRDFEEYVSGPELNLRGELTWHYVLKSVVARVE